MTLATSKTNRLRAGFFYYLLGVFSSFMSTRSKFLVHWPGKDINAKKCDDDAKRDRYLERLRDDYLNGGFAQPCEEGPFAAMLR
jgi:hypothetical protein